MNCLKCGFNNSNYVEISKDCVVILEKTLDGSMMYYLVLKYKSKNKNLAIGIFNLYKSHSFDCWDKDYMVKFINPKECYGNYCYFRVYKKVKKVKSK